MNVIRYPGLPMPTLLICISTQLAEKLEEANWMNRSGEIVEEDALGYKVIYRIVNPELCIVADEVGGNISMKGNGYVGGELSVLW